MTVEIPIFLLADGEKFVEVARRDKGVRVMVSNEHGVFMSVTFDGQTWAELLVAANAEQDRVEHVIDTVDALA